MTQDMQTAISISESTMYPVLRRLQKNNYLTTYDQPYQGRNRRYYQITPEGRTHLERIRKMWGDFKTSLDSVFYKADIVVSHSDLNDAKGNEHG